MDRQYKTRRQVQKDEARVIIHQRAEDKEQKAREVLEKAADNSW